MNIKTMFPIVLKILILTIIMFILFTFGASLVGIESDISQKTTAGVDKSAEQTKTALILLLLCLVDVIILAYFILRSRLYGFRLMLITAILYYGVKTFMTQIETWYFMADVTPESLLKLFLMTVPVTLIFPVIAVFTLGRFKKESLLEKGQGDILSMPIKEWIWKTSLLAAVIYPLLYFSFGYYIAWKNPELRAFYDGTDPGNFFAQLRNIFNETPWLYFLQLLRGLLWIGLAIMIVRFINGKVWQTGIYVGILFSLLMNAALLIPNPFMPETVRLTHFVETASSNFIWGYIIVVLLKWHPKSNTCV